MARVLSWNDDRKKALDQVCSVRAPLKVVLKTKNERYFLERWIDYYINMLSPSGLVILDNGTTDIEVLSVYDKYQGLTIIRFEGFHNNLHAPSKFPDLYRALKMSSDFFCFLDTDEFLIYVDRDTVVKGPSLLTFLDAADAGDFQPTIWLNNQHMSDINFVLGVGRSKIEHGLRWGKPIFASSSDIVYKGHVNHNCEAIAAGAVPILHGGFIILHLCDFIARQRMDVNKEKLIARGFARETDTFQDISNLDLSSATENEKLYVNEIKAIIYAEQTPSEAKDVSLPDRVLNISGGRIHFSAQEDELLFRECQTGFPTLVKTTFS